MALYTQLACVRDDRPSERCLPTISCHGGRTARWVAYIFLFTPARQTFRPSEEIKKLFNGRYLWWKTANMQNLVGKGRWAHWGKGAGSPYILRWVQFCFIRWLKATISSESKTVSNIPRMISQKLKQLYPVLVTTLNYLKVS